MKMNCTSLGTVDKLIEKIIGKVINYWKNLFKKVNVLHMFTPFVPVILGV